MQYNFKRLARQHQIKFRIENLQVGYVTYPTWLLQSDAEKGYNFYNGFGVFKAVKERFPTYKQGLYADILRSEHIPFNLFVPFNNDIGKLFCKTVFNEFLGNIIKTVDKILIEYAPSPADKYLKDRTSFDAYIEYTHIDGQNSFIGIEVKYTEKAYPLKPGSKEEKDISEKSSRYFYLTDNSGIYKPDRLNLLITDKFRQMWRNHLLGQSILLEEKEKFKHFTSVTLFPVGNSHFVETSKEYNDLLQTDRSNFLSITYEEFFLVCKKHCPDNDYKKWLDYITTRYIVTNE